MESPEERFTALFERTHLAVLAYAVRRVTDPADAADVAAEVYLVVWRRLDDVPAGEEARPWIFGIARRVLANHHRGERRRHALADRLGQSLSELVTPAPRSREESLVLLALDRLPEDDRELLRLLAWENLTRDEIAVVMGVSKASLRVRIHRARGRLTRAMASLEAPDPDEEDPKRIALQRIPTTGHVLSERTLVRPDAQETS